MNELLLQLQSHIFYLLGVILMFLLRWGLARFDKWVRSANDANGVATLEALADMAAKYVIAELEDGKDGNIIDMAVDAVQKQLASLNINLTDEQVVIYVKAAFSKINETYSDKTVLKTYSDYDFSGIITEGFTDEKA